MPLPSPSNWANATEAEPARSAATTVIFNICRLLAQRRPIDIDGADHSVGREGLMRTSSHFQMLILALSHRGMPAWQTGAFPLCWAAIKTAKGEIACPI